MEDLIGPADELRYLAILLAVLAAVALAFGAQFQNNAVSNGKAKPKTKDGRGGLGLRQLRKLIVRPQWISGLGLMGLGMVLQLGALTLAPLIVVQPIGALALVITSLLNARVTKTRLNRGTTIAIILCTFGIAAFVTTASGVADANVLTDTDVTAVLAILLGLLVVFAVLFFTSGRSAKPLTYIIGAGVLYGFVATLAKVVIQRLYQMQFDWLTILCLLALVAAVILGGWFVQNAYASGPPDLVIAGLTVIDPLVAVSVAIAILGEAEAATPLTAIGFALSGAIAVAGVVLLSKVHPELAASKQ
ncbi:MAG: DMT family transporter [Rhodoluna sp.]|jgi:drug/metabolite transporter (DMT)-like permease